MTVQAIYIFYGIELNHEQFMKFYSDCEEYINDDDEDGFENYGYSECCLNSNGYSTQNNCLGLPEELYYNEKLIKVDNYELVRYEYPHDMETYNFVVGFMVPSYGSGDTLEDVKKSIEWIEYTEVFDDILNKLKKDIGLDNNLKHEIISIPDDCNCCS